MDNKRTVKTKNNEGTELTLIVKRPNGEQTRDAKMYQSQTFAKAIKKPDALSRDKLDKYLREQGMWDDTKEKKFVDLVKNIRKFERVLAKGGGKLSKLRKTCLDLNRARNEQFALLADKRKHDEFTAEAQAENAYFDHLVSSCVVDEEGNRVFNDIDDYY